MTSIVFLDFDGVTHPEPCLAGMQFIRLPLIEEVLQEFAQVRVVISSSWRLQLPLEVLRQPFSDAMRSRIVGVTPQMAPAWRQEECEAWLSETLNQSTPWIAIDDRAQWFEPGCPNLLRTSGWQGFSSEDQMALRQQLKQKTEFPA